jgi:lipoprotein NlpI
MSERIKQLEQFITDDPADPFNYYALALEHAKIDEHKALHTFTYLITNYKDYLPTYYQLAKLYEGLGQKENSAVIFREGVKIATLQNDLKTLRELRAALQELEGEEEE